MKLRRQIEAAYREDPSNADQRRYGFAKRIFYPTYSNSALDQMPMPLTFEEMGRCAESSKERRKE